MPKQKSAPAPVRPSVMARRRRVLHSSQTDYLESIADLIEDPNAPKRGLSAYMFFANEQRENVREENPGIAFGTLFPLAH